MGVFDSIGEFFSGIGDGVSGALTNFTGFAGNILNTAGQVVNTVNSFAGPAGPIAGAAGLFNGNAVVPPALTTTSKANASSPVPLLSDTSGLLLVAGAALLLWFLVLNKS